MLRLRVLQISHWAQTIEERRGLASHQYAVHKGGGAWRTERIPCGDEQK